VSQPHQDLSEQIAASRADIEKLQDRVKQLVARRGKRAELVKSNGLGADTTHMRRIEPSEASAAARPESDGPRSYTLAEGLEALKRTKMSDVKLIAFKHGAVVLLMSDEEAITVEMDERGPKPLFDLLTANDTIEKVVNFDTPSGTDQQVA